MTVVQPDMKNTFVGKGMVAKTVSLMQECIIDSLPQVQAVAQSLYTGNMYNDCKAAYQYIKDRVKYKNDTPGTEEVRTFARLIKDGKGDCDDMATSLFAITKAMGYNPRLNIVAQNGKEYSHVFTSVGDFPHPDNSKIKGYAMDPVPPLVRFDEIAPNITKVMEAGLSHYKLSGLAGARLTTDVTEKLIAGRNVLIEEIKAQPNGKANAAQSQDLRKLTAVIKMNGTNEQAALLGMMDCIHDVTLSGVIIPNADADLDALTQYLDDFDNEGIEGIAKAKVKLKKAANKTAKPVKKGKAAKTAPQAKASKAVKKAKTQAKKKAGKAFYQKALKVMPLTFAARNGFLEVIKLNMFQLAVQLNVIMQNKNGKFTARKEKLLQMWKYIGGDTNYLQKNIDRGVKLNAKNKAKKGVKGIGEPVSASVIITAASGLIAKVLDLLHGKGGKKDIADALLESGAAPEEIEQATANTPTESTIKSGLQAQSPPSSPTAKDEGFATDADAQVADEAMQANQNSPEGRKSDPNSPDADPTGVETKGGLFENPLVLVGIAAAVAGGYLLMSKK